MQLAGHVYLVQRSSGFETIVKRLGANINIFAQGKGYTPRHATSLHVRTTRSIRRRRKKSKGRKEHAGHDAHEGCPSTHGKLKAHTDVLRAKPKASSAVFNHTHTYSQRVASHHQPATAASVVEPAARNVYRGKANVVLRLRTDFRRPGSLFRI